MIAQARMAFRLQRFEVVAAIVAVAIVAISALAVRVRLDSVGVPASCWDAWFSDGGDLATSRCTDIVRTFLRINEDEGGRVIAAMAILPFALGLFLGVPLVGREIEGKTAPTVWALARSRVRWLAGRLLPMLGLVTLLLVVLAVTSDVLWMGRNPWQPIPNFDDRGLHGIVLIGNGLAAFGIAVIVGAVFGRILPAIVVAIAIGLAGWTLGWTVTDAWLMAEAKTHAVPISEMGLYDESIFPGGTYTSSAWVGPGGEFLFSEEEAIALAPAGVEDPHVWVYENVPAVQLGVPGTAYPLFERFQMLIYGAVALGTLILVFPIVQRRRPM